MFTIKHVTPYGNEVIYETEEVRYTPRAEHRPSDNLALGPSTGQLWYTSRQTGEREDINDGNVYVMNESGSTVAKYDLGGWATTNQDAQDAFNRTMSRSHGPATLG